LLKKYLILLWVFTDFSNHLVASVDDDDDDDDDDDNGDKMIAQCL